MDTSIRLRQPHEMRALPARPARTTLPQPQPQPQQTSKASIDSLRKAILDCAHQATIAEPSDSDRRLHSFIAKLSGTMECLGERELDAVLWNLMATTTPPRQSPAEIAAREFKYLLDVQPKNGLFNPGGTGDARSSAAYANAAALLDQQVSERLDGTAGPGSVHGSVMPVIHVVANDGAGMPASPLQVLERIRISLADLGLQVFHEGDGRSEDGRLLEIGVRLVSHADLPFQQIKGQRDAVHGSVPEKVDVSTFCHGDSITSKAS